MEHLISPKHMRVNWRTVWYGVFLILGSLAIAGWIIVGISMFFIESYFSPNPYIDTKFSDGFTWETWQQVDSGMTKADVRNLLGNPYGEGYGGYGGYFGIKSGENYAENCDVYSEDGAFYWWDFAWIAMQVCYDNNAQVLGKSEIILYD